MKRLLVVTTALLLAGAMAASAAETAAPLLDEVVVDRSTRDKSVNDYILLTRTAIQRAWTTPLDLAVPGAVKGRVRINYTISRSGALKSVELVGSSGNGELDRSLIQAIRSAAPFPPFPDEIRASKMFVRANFVIADLPAATVTTVEHSTTGGVPPEVAESSDLSNQKKLMWGTPAGTSEQQEPKVNRDTPAPPPVKKYKWGL
jgi:TonB family protein